MRTILSPYARLLVLLAALHPQLCRSAEPLTFPWGAGHPQAPAAVQQTSAIGYRVLSTTVHVSHHDSHHDSRPALPVQPLLPKANYAYGWFGSNPNSHKNSQWGRHFGFQQVYTQWTLR
ncbi:MAG: hypothetical protein ABI557_09915 [Aureliella sp.]